MSSLNRRQVLKGGVACTAGALMASSAATATELAQPTQPGTAPVQPGTAPVQRKGNIHQSVARWCYQKIALDDLCAAGAQIGLKGIDLLQPEEYEVPHRYGLVCSMGYATWA